MGNFLPHSDNSIAQCSNVIFFPDCKTSCHASRKWKLLYILLSATNTVNPEITTIVCNLAGQQILLWSLSCKSKLLCWANIAESMLLIIYFFVTAVDFTYIVEAKLFGRSLYHRYWASCRVQISFLSTIILFITRQKPILNLWTLIYAKKMSYITKM